MDGDGNSIFRMRKASFKTALVLAGLLMLTACDREAQEELNPITAIVTVEYKSGKTIDFFYRGELVWTAGPVKSVSYYRDGNMTYIDYTDLSDQQNHLVFQGGKQV
jgi:hypothetical protein